MNPGQPAEVTRLETGYQPTQRFTDRATDRVPRAMAEAIFINSLLATGQYTPMVYGVTNEMFGTYGNVDAYVRRYYDQTGTTPDKAFIHTKFKTFPPTPVADVSFAASEVFDNARAAAIGEAMLFATSSLETGDVDAASDHLSQGLEAVPRGAVAPPVSAGAASLIVDDDATVTHVPVPGEQLARYTSGGIAPGRLWYLGARYGVGKTWQLCRHALAASDGGYSVHFLSLEMPKLDMAERLRWMTMGMAYHSASPTQRAHALAERFERSGGNIYLHDPTSGPVTADVVRTFTADPRSFVIIDYLGLMRTRSGIASIDDWRTAATVTNELREVTLATGIPVLAAVQLSKGADNAKRLTGSHISQTDFAGMDADLIYLMAQSSTHVRRIFLDKNRHGESKISWYTQFDIAQQTYADISAEKAQLLRLADEEIDV